MIELDSAIHELRALLRAVVPRSCEIIYELEADAHVLLARSELSQVVLNLMTNAGEAISGSGGRVTLRTGTERLEHPQLDARYLGDAAEPGDYVYLEVEDDGEGMDADTTERLFEPFYSTKSTGRGLGTAVIVGVLRSARGVAEVETAVGQGTRIRVSLPVATPLAQTTRETTRPSSDGPASHGTILVVDDEPSVAHMISRMLERLGYETHVAGSGEQALAIHERDGPRLTAAIVDLTMPGMSGLELLRVLKSRSPTLPVLLATGYSSDDIPSGDTGPLHEGFLAKPFSYQQLREQLQAILDT